MRWTNLLTMWMEFLIRAALTFTFGRMVGNMRQGWALTASWASSSSAACSRFLLGRRQREPGFAKLGVDQGYSHSSRPATLGGKEVRFGVTYFAMFATTTTDTSDGAVNSMHDSFTPIGGLVPIVNMQLGEIIFGGVGCGLYGMLLFAIIALFVAGLMVGRTPEISARSWRRAR